MTLFRSSTTAIATIALGLALTTSLVRADDPRPDTLMVDDFDLGIRNQLNGVRNAFARAPSISKAKRIYGDAHGAEGLCVRLTTRQAEAGHCGFWVQMCDRRNDPIEYLDSIHWNFIAFRIRGQVGGEDLLVKLADAQWSANEDSMPVGYVSDYLPGGVKTEWREVVMPINQVPRLKRHQLASISFKCETDREQTVFIDDIHFKRLMSSKLPAPAPRQRIEPKVTSTTKALWVWSTANVIRSPEESRELLEVCQRDHIQRLWMQLSYDRVPAARLVTEDALATPIVKTDPSASVCKLRHVAELRSFLRAAHLAGIEVEALDGHPEFALSAQHHKPLSLVDAVIAFNQESDDDSRFAGIHFDNEPYLVLGWSDPAVRESILQDFMTLNVECQERCRAQGLRFGVDIPFWWQSKSRPDAEPTGIVTFRGARKPASHHCIDWLDSVGIMNYRDAADGADGMLSHGSELLRYSDTARHAQIHLGIETINPAPTEVRMVAGLPIDEFREALQDRAREFAELSRYRDFRIARFDDGQRVHVGLALPRDRDPAKLQGFDQALLEVARAFGHVKSSRGDIPILNQAEAQLEKNPEWNGFELSDIVDEELGVTFLGFRSTQVIPGKVTFGDDTLEDLHEEVEFAERGFRQHASYAGIAVHSWEGYRRMKSKTAP